MAAKERTGTKTGTARTMTVACKIPNGLHLRTFRPVEVQQPVMGGGTRAVREFQEIPGGDFVLKGPAHEAGKDPKARVSSGFALTFGVPAEIWESWYESNKGSDVVRNHLVFAYETTEDAEACAREHEKQTSGLEGIDPENPGRRVRGIQKGSKKEGADGPTISVPVAA